MIRYLTIAILVLVLYTFFDVARTDQDKIRSGPKWAWLISIILFEMVGVIAWFAFGRPKNNRGPKPGKKKIIPPDDDPDFLRKI
jgi:hypothetical protein